MKKDPFDTGHENRPFVMKRIGVWMISWPFLDGISRFSSWREAVDFALKHRFKPHEPSRN